MRVRVCVHGRDACLKVRVCGWESESGSDRNENVCGKFRVKERVVTMHKQFLSLFLTISLSLSPFSLSDIRLVTRFVLKRKIERIFFHFFYFFTFYRNRKPSKNPSNRWPDWSNTLVTWPPPANRIAQFPRRSRCWFVLTEMTLHVLIQLLGSDSLTSEPLRKKTFPPKISAESW